MFILQSDKTSDHKEDNGASHSTAVDIFQCNEKAPTSSVAEQKTSDDKIKMSNLQTDHHIIEILDDTNISVCSEGQIFCRICHAFGEEPLVAPCRCAGTAKWVHASCLITWLKKSIRNTCELCRTHIKIAKKVKKVSEWQLPQKKPFSILWCIIFLLGLAINMAGIVLHAIEECVGVLCVAFYILNGLGIVINILLLVGWIPDCVIYCMKWFALNQEWVLMREMRNVDESLVDNENYESIKKDELVDNKNESMKKDELVDE